MGCKYPKYIIHIKLFKNLKSKGAGINPKPSVIELCLRSLETAQIPPSRTPVKVKPAPPWCSSPFRSEAQGEREGPSLSPEKAEARG